MRRGMMLVVGFAGLAAMALRPRTRGRPVLPGALFGVMTRPFGAILGGPPIRRRSHRHRRAAASRSRAGQRARAAVARRQPPRVGRRRHRWRAPLRQPPAPDRQASSRWRSRRRPRSIRRAPRDHGRRRRDTRRGGASTSATGRSVTHVPDHARRRRDPARRPSPSSIRSPLAGRARGARRSARSGPLTWPTAYEDVIGFTLWPSEYGERLRSHGIGDVLERDASCRPALRPPSHAVGRPRGADDANRLRRRQRRELQHAPGKASTDWPARRSSVRST